MSITKAYNQLTTVSKEITRDKIQNLLGYSRATFYSKINNDDNLTQLEAKQIAKIIKTELRQQIALSTDALNQLENTINYVRK